MTEIHCFKAYDVRGQVPEELNEDIAYRIARAYVEFLSPTQIAVCRDIRTSSNTLSQALIKAVSYTHLTLPTILLV